MPGSGSLDFIIPSLSTQAEIVCSRRGGSAMMSGTAVYVQMTEGSGDARLDPSRMSAV
jgi:hypothetical protein